MTTEQSEYTLEDAEALNRANPDTFEIPDIDERTSLRRGDVVKLIFTRPDGNSERMWVVVQFLLADGGYFGELDNDPVLIPIEDGWPVFFEARHVIAIHDCPAPA
jgi:hypothetical protein